MKKITLSLINIFLLLCGEVHAQVDNYSLKLAPEGYVNFRTMPELDNLSSYTIQFWLNVSEWNKGATIYQRGEAFSASLGETNSIQFSIGNQTIEAFSQELTAGNWCQVTFFCDNNNGKIYINGAVAYDDTKELPAVPASEEDFIIGGGLSGRVDEFRIWNDLLSMDYEYFRYNTLNKWAPQWDNLIAYYKFDQNLCEHVVDYTFKHHGIFSPTGAQRDIVTDNADFKYLINSAYTDFTRFFDRAIDREKYLLANDLIILGISSYEDGSLSLPYPDNQGTVVNGSYLSEYEGRTGVLSLTGNGVGMEVGNFAMNPEDRYTFSTWIYLEEWTEGAYIFRKENEAGTQGVSLRLGAEETNQVIIRVNGRDYVNQRRMTTGKWMHFGVSTYADNLTIEETFIFYFDGRTYFGTKDMCGTTRESWTPAGAEEMPAIIGYNLNAKLDETVIWHSYRSPTNILSDMEGLPMPGFDTVLTASVMADVNSFWTYDDPENVGYDSYSYKHFVGIMREAYEGHRGYKIRMSVKSHDGWEQTFANADKRKKLAQYLAEIAEEFDGVDLDFEWCYSQSCWDSYGELLLEIEKVLGKDKILTVSPHRVSYSLRPKYMDRVDFFTFQIYGPQGDNFKWDVFVNAYNSFINQGYPKEKILLSYAATTSRGYQNGVINNTSSPIGVRNGLLDGDYTPDMDIVKDDQGLDRYITGFNQTYERSKFTRDNGLKGIFYWDMGNDVKTWHQYSLVKASSYAINSNVDSIVTKVNLDPVSITPIKKNESEMKIYPNPARDSISFELPDNKTPHRVQLFNMAGLCVKSEESNSSNIYINDMTDGTYGITVLTTSGDIYKGVFMKKE